MEILSAGLIVADIMARPVDRSTFDSVTDTALLEDIKYSAGGDAFNVAVNLSKLGVNTGLCGIVGQDFAGDFLVAEAHRNGVDTRNVRRTAEYPTSTSLVLCSAKGERHFAYHGECNNTFSADMVTDEMLAGIKILYIGSVMALQSLKGDSLAALLKRAKEKGIVTAMDATSDNSGEWFLKIEHALPYVDLFFPSYDEAVQLCGEREISGMKRFFRKQGLRQFGVKLGKDGCYITDFKEECSLPAFPCDRVVDVCGAGDAFMSGYLYGMLKGFPMEGCARFGSAVSNFCIRALGTTANTPTAEQVYEFLKQQKGAE